MLALLITACLLSGCYERVVGVTGPGARSYDIHEANLNPDQEKSILQGIGDFFGAIFGIPPEDENKR